MLAVVVLVLLARSHSPSCTQFNCTLMNALKRFVHPIRHHHHHRPYNSSMAKMSSLCFIRPRLTLPPFCYPLLRAADFPFLSISLSHATTDRWLTVLLVERRKFITNFHGDFFNSTSERRGAFSSPSSPSIAGYDSEHLQLVFNMINPATRARP